MKVAISFSGLPRITEHSVSSWKWMIENFSCDVYFHLWDTNNENVKVLFEHFKPIVIQVEPLREFNVEFYKDRLQQSNPYNVLSMWSSIYESIKLIKNSHINYDIVVRARTDVAFEHFSFEKNQGITIPGKAAEIYTWNNKQYPGWHDMMAYGNIESMQTYADTLHAIPKIYSQGSPFFSEFFLSTHLHQERIPVTHHAVHADIVR